MNDTPEPLEPTINIISGSIKPRPPEAGDAPEAADLDAVELTTWDEPIETTGYRVPRVGMEDEKSAAIELVEQGLDQADDSLRANVEEE